MRISDWSSDVCSSDLRTAASLLGSQNLNGSRLGFTTNRFDCSTSRRTMFCRCLNRTPYAPDPTFTFTPVNLPVRGCWGWVAMTTLLSGRSVDGGSCRDSMRAGAATLRAPEHRRASKEQGEREMTNVGTAQVPEGRSGQRVEVTEAGGRELGRRRQ